MRGKTTDVGLRSEIVEVAACDHQRPGFNGGAHGLDCQGDFPPLRKSMAVQPGIATANIGSEYQKIKTSAGSPKTQFMEQVILGFTKQVANQ